MTFKIRNSAIVLFSLFLATTPARAAGVSDCARKFTHLAVTDEQTSRTHLDPIFVRPLNESIPKIEQAAYQALESAPGTAGLIRFNEVIDEAVRANPEYPKALLQLAANRLPYIKNEATVVFLSGGVADPWAPVLQESARSSGMRIKIAKLPGSLSFARGGNQKAVPEFSAEIRSLLKEHPAIFLDDTYTNGGTASAVREAVSKSGGKLDGVFVVYEGGKGDPASLYKTGRNNRRPPSMGNFPDRPTGWTWADGQPKKLAIEIDGTLTNASDPTRLTEQGKTLLHNLEAMGTPVQLLKHGKPTAPPAYITTRFQKLRILGMDAKPDLAIGNWGRDFRGTGPKISPVSTPHVETLRIGASRDEGILSEELLDPNYFLNRLSEMGVLKPEYPGRKPLVSRVGDDFSNVADLRAIAAPKAERGSHRLAEILQIEDPKARVARLSKINWDELTEPEQVVLLSRAPHLTNSFEVGQMIRIAGGSRDGRWKPILQSWIDSWKDIAKGWQTFVRPEAEKSLASLTEVSSHPVAPSITERFTSSIEGIMIPKPPQVASIGTEIDGEVQAAGMLPRGAAIVTSSGDLSRRGIRHIIHAATGSMTRSGRKFDPTVKSVTDSIRNSLELAKAHGHHRVAIPFIGGKIFVERIGVSPQELADRIVESALQNRGNLELRFVTFGEEDTRLFKNALAKQGASLSPVQAAVTPGSITDYSLHGASAIINAANMEVKFGGGLSGAIGQATGDSRKIDQEAEKAIQPFYSESH